MFSSYPLTWSMLVSRAIVPCCVGFCAFIDVKPRHLCTLLVKSSRMRKRKEHSRALRASVARPRRHGPTASGEPVSMPLSILYQALALLVVPRIADQSLLHLYPDPATFEAHRILLVGRDLEEPARTVCSSLWTDCCASLFGYLFPGG